MLRTRTFRHFWQEDMANRESIQLNDVIKPIKGCAANRQKESKPLQHCADWDLK
jgi:hypothetical protein